MTIILYNYSSAAGGASTMNPELTMIPQPNAWDYIHITFNAICCLVGLPINLATFRWLRKKHREREKSGRVIVLHQHLNISDILVLVVVCACRSVWLYTYTWPFGDVACRAMRFSESVSFAISSNVLVCIALNRLYSLQRPLLAKQNAAWRVRVMVVTAWTLAAVVCLPQLVVWRVYEHHFDNGERFTQCVSFWVARTHNNSTYEGIELEYQLYDYYLLVVIFWIPVAILFSCYGLILFHVYRFLNRQTGKTALDLATTANGDEQQGRSSSNCSSQESPADRATRRPSARKAVLLRRVTAGSCTLQHQDNVQKSKMKALRVTLVLMLAYILCYLPYNVLTAWAKIDATSYKRVETYLYLLHFLIALNSVVNPFIYNSRFTCQRDSENRRRQHQQRNHRRRAHL